MRLVIDLEGIQRGGDRAGPAPPPLDLALAIARNRGDHEVLIVLSDQFSDTVPGLRAAFHGVLPPRNIRLWQGTGPAAAAGTRLALADAAMRAAFVAALRPDRVLAAGDLEAAIAQAAFTGTAVAGAAVKGEAVKGTAVKGTEVGDGAAATGRNPPAPDVPVPGLLAPDIRMPDISAMDVLARGILAAAPPGSTGAQPASLSLSGPPSASPASARAPSARPASARAPSGVRPRLAFVSPLPPERSGIADYSAELLPALAEWYQIDVIAPQPEVSDPWLRDNCPLRSPDWLQEHAADYDRVLYHFGNSGFHAHMFGLLRKVPGVVVLHEFFLGHGQGHRDQASWIEALQAGHGYHAVLARDDPATREAALWEFPANLQVLQDAMGVVVHSAEQCRLADRWYGPGAAADWAVIPHLRVPVAPAQGDRREARQAIGVPADALVICVFGVTGAAKLNHRTLAAFLGSELAADPKAHLIFVGDGDGSDYSRDLRERIRAASAEMSDGTRAVQGPGGTRAGQGPGGASSGNGRIRSTGWADAATFRACLAAADIAVQLRSRSRGETSGTVLDCMNHGLATVVNAHGTMADLDPQGVVMLPDAFTDAELVAVLEDLAANPDRRAALGAQGQAIIRAGHAPAECAARYAEAVEGAYARDAALSGLIRRLAAGLPAPAPDPVQYPARDPVQDPARDPVRESLQDRGGDPDVPALAQVLARNFPPQPRLRQLLVDVSAVVVHDLRTGIQRMVRAILDQWLRNPPPGWLVEPVYARDDRAGYLYARRYARAFLDRRTADLPRPDLGHPPAEDVPVDVFQGDMFLALDFHMGIIRREQGRLDAWHRAGVDIRFIVHDLLPEVSPQYFPPADVQPFRDWLGTITRFDGVMCVSAATADELRRWCAAQGIERKIPLQIGWFHHGADIMSSAPALGLPQGAEAVLARLAQARASGVPVFLMVGTVEPRKGHAQVLAAFEDLWAQGVAAHLVIVGKPGWNVAALVERLRRHPQAGGFLHWPDAVSDEFLERLYAAATCLIAASEGEGFGLPLIEAAQHRLPILARDLAVFREVAGDHAAYFSGTAPGDLRRALTGWMALHAADRHPRPDAMPWQTWAQSAAQLLDRLGIAAP